jgi:hypothetical protein
MGGGLRLAYQPLDAGPQCQMLALDVLRVAFASLVLVRIEMTRVSTPIVCVIARDAKRLKQRFELEEYLILAASKDIRQDFATAVINRVPQPPWFFLALNK